VKKIILTIIIVFAAYGFLFAQSDTGANHKMSVVSAISKDSYNFVDTLGNKYFNNGYYMWRVTGSPEIDAQNLDKAAQDFKKNHPVIYHLIASDVPKIKMIKKADFLRMSEADKKIILSKPTVFTIKNAPN